MGASIAYPRSYIGAVCALRGKARRKVGHNTWLVQRPDAIELVYHSTAIVTLYSNGNIKLDHGGWETRTTLTRLSHALAALGLGGVFQRRGSWYLTFPDGGTLPYVNGQVFYRESSNDPSTNLA
jgi:hypothetical protein